MESENNDAPNEKSETKTEIKKPVTYGLQELNSWNNEFRPRSLDDIIGQDAVVKKLKAYEKEPLESNIPMIFVGKPGIGKSTTAEVWRKELFTKAIDIPQAEEKHAEFIKTVISLLTNNMARYSEQGGDKLILNEGHRLSKKSMDDLLEPLRKYGAYTKVIITTISTKNFQAKGDQLAAFLRRFRVLEFQPLSKSDLKKVANKVIEAKKIEISSTDLNKILEQANSTPALLIDDLQEYYFSNKVPDRRNYANDPPTMEGFSWKYFEPLNYNVIESVASKWVVWCSETGLPGIIDSRHNELIPIPLKYSPTRFPDGLLPKMKRCFNEAGEDMIEMDDEFLSFNDFIKKYSDGKKFELRRALESLPVTWEIAKDDNNKLMEKFEIFVMGMYISENTNGIEVIPHKNKFKVSTDFFDREFRKEYKIEMSYESFINKSGYSKNTQTINGQRMSSIYGYFKTLNALDYLKKYNEQKQQTES